MLKLNRFYFDQAISIDNALTTNQLIHQIVNEINKMIDVINNIDSKANEYTDSQIAIVNGEIEELREELSNSITALEAYAREAVERGINAFDDDSVKPRLQALYDALDEVDNRLDSKIDREVDILDTKIDRTKNELIYLVDQVKAELIELIKKGGAVYSGYTGLLTALQDEIYNIYNVYSKFFGLTWDCFDKYISQYTYMYYVGARGYDNSKIINNGTFKSLLFGADIVSYSVTSESNNYTLTVNLSSALNNGITIIRFNNVDIPDNDFIISADRKTFIVNNLDVSLLDYSCNLLRLGSYTGDNYSVILNLYLSNFDAVNKINLTWYTIDRLIHYDGLDISYDFVNYYFYTDFASVISKFTLTDGESQALLNTLKGYSTVNGNPNYLSSYNAFGLNDTVFLNSTEDKISKTTKSRIF